MVKYRVFVEIQWLRFLIENVENDILAKFNHDDMDKLMAITNEFNYDSFARIKEIENTTRHDVKAVEYFIDEQVKALGFEYLQKFCSYWVYFQKILIILHMLV